ncbi:MAG: TIGR00153 family protein [Calditrichaeota bacterium]|nr:MAG: TIGR00153 family protein [Calditrichota bacterium]MBL1204800.1 TIGR00153 family protein [Calditrichota bacterium]NOG44629.1 TIGR00153 family protein [Calditrichota bacterium]
MSLMENLFSRSPFTPLQTHMEKVAKCVNKLDDLYEAFVKNDSELLLKLTDEISDLEHSADLTKNDIRSNLPRGLFLAINRADLLQILSLQDSIADAAEDVAVIMTLKKIEPIKGLKAELKAFLDKNTGAVESVHQIIHELERLLQSSFGGAEAKRVKQMVNDVAFLEHEVDIMQRGILKKLYNMETKLDYASFNLWINIIQTVSSLSNLSEKLAYKISSLIETN